MSAVLTDKLRSSSKKSSSKSTEKKMTREDYMQEVRNARNAKQDKEYLKACKDFVSYARKTKRSGDLAMAYYYMAEYYYIEDPTHEKTAMYLARALRYAEEVSDYNAACRIYNLLGIDVSNRGLVELGIQYYILALSAARRCNNKEFLTKIYFNLGCERSHMDDWDGAFQSYHMSIRNGKRWGYKNELAVFCAVMVHCEQGLYYFSLSEVDKACMEYRAIVEIMTNNPDAKAVLREDPILMMFLACYYHMMNQMTERDLFMQKLFKLVDDEEFPVDCIPEVLTLSYYMIEMGYNETAKKVLDTIEPIVLKYGLVHMQMIFYRDRMILCKKEGNMEGHVEAMEHYFEANELQSEERKKTFRNYMDMMKEMDRIQKENMRLEQEANTDALTGIANRMCLNARTEQAFEEAWANKTSLGIEIFDLDNFKRYNDQYGHSVGDVCLKKIADVLKKISSDKVFVSRYGGDEFLLIYYNMTDEEILAVAQKIKKMVEALRIPIGDGQYEHVSISQGIRNSIPNNENRLWDYLSAADNALYEVKKTHRGEILLVHKAGLSEESFSDTLSGET